jgi:tRNA (guanine37-N1)-methyltransferase
MKISILTLFPEMFKGPFDQSIIKNATEKGLAKIDYVNIRDFGQGKHKTVDDTEYGGGIGMVMKVDVLYQAIESTKTNKGKEKVILLSATGSPFNQNKARELAQIDHLILLCGHYEGVDERIKEYIDEEISIGDFILTGGEIPAMLITDSIIRLLPGVLPVGAPDDESFSEIDGALLLEYPHYTKPREFKGKKVPDLLLSGNHPKIKEWRRSQSLEITASLRPELLKKRSS